jgi:hypothetical protein
MITDIHDKLSYLAHLAQKSGDEIISVWLDEAVYRQFKLEIDNCANVPCFLSEYTTWNGIPIHRVPIDDEPTLSLRLKPKSSQGGKVFLDWEDNNGT